MLPALSSLSIISRCTVAPNCRSPLPTMKLPVSDLPIMLSCQYIRKGKLYTKPSFSRGHLLPLLKQALSRTLTHFPHLAGRLTTNSDGFVHIICNDLGVEFIHAKATHVSTGDILSPTHVPADSVEEFFLFDRMISYSSHYQPLLAVQVTELADAIFIGCTVNPAVTDGSTSFWNFFNSIAGTFLNPLSTEWNSKKENADILRLKVIRERAPGKSSPVIPFTFSFVLLVLCLSMSSHIIVLCTASYRLAKVSPGDIADNPSFSIPLYGILDSRIRIYYVVRSGYAFLSVGHLCFIFRTLINNSKFEFPQILKDIVVYSKPEIDFIVGKILSDYLSKNTNKEDPLIVFAIAGAACFVSSCLAFITGPEPQSLFSILTTMFSCGISYASSKRLWNIVYSCLACHVCSFLLYLPIVIIKKEWVVKILVFVLFYLLLSFLLVSFNRS